MLSLPIWPSLGGMCSKPGSLASDINASTTKKPNYNTDNNKDLFYITLFSS